MRDETLNKLCADVILLLERDGLPAIDRFARIGAAPLRYTGERYRGGNALALWATREIKGYGSPYWATYRQAAADGANVRRGEKGTTVVFWSETENAQGEKHMFARAYTVFNADQIQGLDPKYYPLVARSENIPDHAAAEEFVAHLGVQRREGNSACYIHAPVDTVMMPPRAAFATQDGFYATLFHEIVHWSGAENRARRPKGQKFGDAAYAMEELVAELGAALLCRDFEISKTPREDHAAYLASWLKGLKGDPMLLWSAASAAETATTWLHTQAGAALPAALAA